MSTATSSAGNILAAVDLDRTLIFSAAGLGWSGPDDRAPRLLTVEFLNGVPQSYLTVDAATMLAELAGRALLVPVTTRTVAQYRRVRLPIPPGPAITSNGGQLLFGDVPDPEWAARTARLAAGQPTPLAAVTAELARRADAEWVRSRRVAEDLFCYLVVESGQMPPTFADDWRAWCADRGWRVSVQGRKVYALPDWLTKQAAVAELLERSGCDRLVAAGDGALDADLLELAAVGVRPRHGELEELGWHRPHVLVTDDAGVIGGEQVVRLLLAAVAG